MLNLQHTLPNCFECKKKTSKRIKRIKIISNYVQKYLRNRTMNYHIVMKMQIKQRWCSNTIKRLVFIR